MSPSNETPNTRRPRGLPKKLKKPEFNTIEEFLEGGFNVHSHTGACTICCENASQGNPIIVLKSCSHTMCSACIFTWIDMKETCPFCRTYLYVKDPLVFLSIYTVDEYLQLEGYDDDLREGSTAGNEQ